MAIKLIGLDVDGTLMNSRNQLTPGTVQALQAAADRGVHVALATGRMLSECGELLAQLPMIRDALTCTGTQVIDLQTGETLFRHSLTADELRRLCRKFDGLDTMLEIFDDRDGLIHNSAWHLANAERYCSHGLAEAIRRYHGAEENLAQYLEDFTGPTNKLHMFFGTIAEKQEGFARMAGEPYVYIESCAKASRPVPLSTFCGMISRSLAQLSM